MYFSERELGPRPRIENEIGGNVWGGLAVYINGLADSGYFGNAFPEICGDNDGVVGTNKSAMALVLCAEFPSIEFPFDPSRPPPTLAILDLLEFCHEHVAKPIQGYYHSFYHRYHLDFNVEAGQFELRERINRILVRNGLAFEIQSSGQVVRLGPPVLRDYLQGAVYRTGDLPLDTLLETARTKYMKPSLEVRLEGLEKLWDAWERIKSLEDRDKKKSVGILLEKASSEPNMRARLDAEARELTEIGNHFMIRHTETDKIPIVSSPHVDYLFHRMFALVNLLLGPRISMNAASRGSESRSEPEDELPF